MRTQQHYEMNTPNIRVRGREHEERSITTIRVVYFSVSSLYPGQSCGASYSCIYSSRHCVGPSSGAMSITARRQRRAEDQFPAETGKAGDVCHNQRERNITRLNNFTSSTTRITQKSATRLETTTTANVWLRTRQRFSGTCARIHITE